MMSLFVVCAAAVVIQSVSSQLNPVPGIGWIGSSIHLLNGLDPFGTIVQHTFSGAKTSDGRFDISDGVIDAPNVKCSYSSLASTSSSYEEHQLSKSSRLKISGKFGKFAGAYTSMSETVKRSIYNNKQAASFVTADCVQYELNMVRSGGTLRSWFVSEALALPQSIGSSSDLQQYFEFFDYYGTHIVTGCEVGGQLSQFSFTDEAYVESHSRHTTTQQAEASFFVSVDASNSKTMSVDSKYAESTTTWNIQTVGGRWPASTENWAPWIQSVQSLDNVACINWSARDLSDAWAWSAELAPRQSVVEQALSAYFDVQGCTIPTALNYNDKALINSGCEYPAIPEFRICFQETEGSSQCQGVRASCSAWSHSASYEDLNTWTAGFRDDTDGRSGGCKYQWRLEQRDGALTMADHSAFKYRLCFKELEGSSQCQGARETCSGWNDAEQWTAEFRDDTDGRSGGCRYYWFIEAQED